MIGRTNVGGGGGAGNTIAYIGVTYQAGATVTCTKGTKTLRAKDTSGLYVFLIPEIGTWTVTATLGSQTKSETVEITTMWQDVVVDLGFWDGELFDNGNQFIDVTGGWQYNPDVVWVSGDATYNGATIGSTIAVTTTGNLTSCAVQTVNPINLRGYTRLDVVGDGIHNAGYYNAFLLLTFNSGYGIDYLARGQVLSGTVSVDLSSLDQSALENVYPTVFTRNATDATIVSSIKAYRG